MNKRILFVLTSHASIGPGGKPTGAYLSEITHPFDELTRSGATIDFVSVQGGAAPLDGVDRKDPINAKYLDDPTFMARLQTTAAPSEIDSGNYDAVFRELAAACGGQRAAGDRAKPGVGDRRGAGRARAAVRHHPRSTMM